jgi:hypothetical protein
MQIVMIIINMPKINNLFQTTSTQHYRLIDLDS